MKVWHSSPKPVGLDQDGLCAQGCGQREWTSVTRVIELIQALGSVDVQFTDLKLPDLRQNRDST